MCPASVVGRLRDRPDQAGRRRASPIMPRASPACQLTIGAHRQRAGDAARHHHRRGAAGSTTGYYIDEAPVGSVNAYTGGNAITPDLDPSDLAQIEVLKGPQGTLYGAGAVGGLLKFTTVEPSLERFRGRASRPASPPSRRARSAIRRAAMINIPLVTGPARAPRRPASIATTPATSTTSTRGSARKDVNDAQVRGGRAVLAMKFGPDVRLDLSAIGAGHDDQRHQHHRCRCRDAASRSMAI